MKEENKKEKSNLEIFLLIVWQAFYLCWLVYDWGHKIGHKKGFEAGKNAEATAKATAEAAKNALSK